MQTTEKILFDTLKLNLKILEVNWNSLEQNPPNKRIINETINNINQIISNWDRNNFVRENYYKNSRNRRRKLNEIYQERA